MRKVKDKRIQVHAVSLFIATVEYFQDTPERDKHTPVSKLCSSIHEAQKYLAGFPRDIWDGSALSAINYREIDERRKLRRKAKPRQPDRRTVFGRTFARK
jgi:hypothetical protein